MPIVRYHFRKLSDEDVSFHVPENSTEQFIRSVAVMACIHDGIDMTERDVSDCHFENEVIRNVDFSKSNCSRQKYVNCKISDVIFDGSVADEIEFIDCILEKVSFRKVKSSNVKIINSDLKDFDFTGGEYGVIDIENTNCKFLFIDEVDKLNSLLINKNGSPDFSLIHNFSISGSEVETFLLRDAEIEHFSASNSFFDLLSMSNGTLDSHLEDSKFSDVSGLRVKSLSLSNYQILRTFFEDVQIGSVDLESSSIGDTNKFNSFEIGRIVKDSASVFNDQSTPSIVR